MRVRYSGPARGAHSDSEAGLVGAAAVATIEDRSSLQAASSDYRRRGRRRAGPRWDLIQRIRATALMLCVCPVFISGCGSGRDTREPPIVVERSHEIVTITDKGAERDVTEGEDATWFPDHTAIAFTRVVYVNPPITSVWTARSNGTNIQQILVTPQPDQVRFISVGGHPARIAFVDDGGIWLMKPDGSEVHEILRTEANQVAVSPDGSTIAYVTSELHHPSSIKLIDMSGHELGTAFSATPHTCSVNDPTWSADGAWLAFGLCVNKGGLNDEQGIWVVHRSGTDLHRIAREGVTPTWSPDGQWIAYVTSHLNSEHNEELAALERMHPDGSGLSKLTPFTPTSPPPQQIAAPENPQW